MGMTDFLKKWKRLVENYLMYRRSYLFIIILLFLIFYLYPSFHDVYWKRKTANIDSAKRCLDDHLTPYILELQEGNTNIRYIREYEDTMEVDESYLPFVGNGYIGMAIHPRSSIYINHPDTKILDLSLGWSPLLLPVSQGSKHEALATHFPSGIVSRYQCYSSGLYLSQQIFSHRSRKEVLIQEMKIANPTSIPMVLSLDNNISTLEKLILGVEHRILKLKDNKNENSSYNLISGTINSPEENGGEIGICILIKTVPPTLRIEPHRTTILVTPTIVFTELLNKNNFYTRKSFIENKCIEIMKTIKNLSSSQLKQEHIDAWYKLWSTGLYISKSKAAGALNGDKINATIYYVLSNIPLNVLPTKQNTTSIKPYTSYAEGCYGGYHHTLQAVNLWKSLKSIEEIKEIVSLWLLTLDKQGCHKLIKIGALGIIQAMVLSFGGFRFTAQHLEFKIDPKFLHRDYVFRRIYYDDMTFINITVTLQDDNKAQLGVALDKNDRPYYACDGGCNDEPVQLGNMMSYFPVKMTEPITSILYITPDKNHMELIKDTLHVHKIVEAPAYDHQVIALHRHGHHLGGLPTIFWASICFLIIIFHLFLFKLIFNEYCDRQDKHRNRYGKM